MDAEFFVLPGTPKALEKLELHNPENPFQAAGYARSMRELGSEPWVAGRREGDRWLSATSLFLRRGRLNYAAEFPSVPPEAGRPEFWSDFLRFCARRGITRVQADTFGSPAVELPALPGEISRRSREEYVIDLTDDLDKRMSKKHLQRFRKAREIGLTLRRGRDGGACREHLRVIGASLERRRERGESIESHELERSCVVFLKHGCGELFQAMSGETVLASALVLRAAKGSYYQSSGTTPDGMASGASDFLIHSIAGILKDEGQDALNLGGAPAGSSLAQFKSRFGTRIVPTSAVSLYTGPVWRRKLTNLVKLSQQHPGGLVPALLGHTKRLKVYAAETARIAAPADMPGTEFVCLDANGLKNLKAADAEFRQKQLERLDRLGQSYAYGLFVEGKIAHISWLLPSAALKKEDPLVLDLPGGHAEISCCETLPEYRGQGLYPFVIRKLCAIARQQGIRRVYMKTDSDNKSSQSGILKAGLARVGSVVLVSSPLMGSRPRVFRFVRG